MFEAQYPLHPPSSSAEGPVASSTRRYQAEFAQEPAAGGRILAVCAPKVPIVRTARHLLLLRTIKM